MWSGMSDLCSCWSGKFKATTPPAETRANCTGGRSHCLCNPAKTRPLLSQPCHLVAIHNPARTSQGLPLELRVAQPGPDSFLNQGAFKFGHRTNDLKQEPPGGGFFYQAARWKTARRVVSKVEFHAGSC